MLQADDEAAAQVDGLVYRLGCRCLHLRLQLTTSEPYVFRREALSRGHHKNLDAGLSGAIHTCGEQVSMASYSSN